MALRPYDGRVDVMQSLNFTMETLTPTLRVGPGLEDWTITISWDKDYIVMGTGRYRYYNRPKMKTRGYHRKRAQEMMLPWRAYARRYLTKD